MLNVPLYRQKPTIDLNDKNTLLHLKNLSSFYPELLNNLEWLMLKW